MNHKYSTVALLLLGTIMAIAILGSSTSEELWTDEIVNGTVTLVNTSEHLCIGDTCWNDYQVSIKNNASINGSPICTVANSLCTVPATATGSNAGTALCIGASNELCPCGSCS